jgi:hypothetical protein
MKKRLKKIMRDEIEKKNQSKKIKNKINNN